MHRYANLLTLKTDNNSQSEAEIIYRKVIKGREKAYGYVLRIIHTFNHLRLQIRILLHKFSRCTNFGECFVPGEIAECEWRRSGQGGRRLV